jgi:uncharacterized repeat protein (TIGR03806 family)
MRPVLALALLAACGGNMTSPAPDAALGADAPAAQLPYAKLSQYGFFKGTGATQEPVDGVVPYTVVAPLFADFAGKQRFIVLPKGGQITYQADDKWVFPTGAMIVKTFGYGTKLIETRVLIHQADGWLPTTYLWDDAQTDATLLLTGTIVDAQYTDAGGKTGTIGYRVPNQNECFTCHGQRGATNVLGLRTRQINRPVAGGTMNQIDMMVGLGMFDGAVPTQRAALTDPYGTGAVEARARSWLEANCSHCHNPTGAAMSTGLFLTSDVTTPVDFGVCRAPNAAGPGSGGRLYDVVPGHPEQSVMTYRIAIDAAKNPELSGQKMPPIPIQLVDQGGVDVVTQWITGLPGNCN